MSILVDSSVWIDFLRNTGRADELEFLIEENIVIVNDLILAELIPPLAVQKKMKLISLLREINRQVILIDWNEIIKFQTICLANGINGVGIPDLIIAQNALQGRLKLMTNDKHFILLSRHIGIELYEG
jgi:predicted nucleic acid-binding protein